ncbi:MAG: hypothetical protein ACREUT_11685 [Steroidobacteraceae bacterium]
MAYVSRTTITRSHQILFNVLRPVVRILRVSGFEEEEIRSVVARACKLYARTPARGMWLDQTHGLGLDQARVTELMDLLRVWSQDPEFVDDSGQPKRLSLDAGAGSFRALMRRAKCSRASRRTLEQLQALGSVQLCNRGKQVRLLSDILVPVKRKRFAVAPMLNSLRWFEESLEHNLCDSPRRGEGRLHRWVICADLNPARLMDVERYVRSNGQTLIESIDEKLSSCAVRSPKRRAITYGVGLHVFIERPVKRQRHSQKSHGR